MNKIYANLYLYTDVEPFEVIKRVSEKTIHIRRMKSNPILPKMEFVVGGFSAHCKNQHEQTWEIQPDPNEEIIVARLHRKDGKFHSKYGMHRIEDVPKRFYDYNF